MCLHIYTYIYIPFIHVLIYIYTFYTCAYIYIHIYIYIPFIHVLTGAEATSGFFGKGKKTVMKNAFKCISETKERLEDFGKTLVLSEKVINDLIMFVIRFIYNDKKSKTLAESRVALW